MILFVSLSFHCYAFYLLTVIRKILPDFYFFREGNNNASKILNKDKEWIVNSSKIMEKLMKDYDPSIAPFVPGK